MVVVHKQVYNTAEKYVTTEAVYNTAEKYVTTEAVYNTAGRYVTTEAVRWWLSTNKSTTQPRSTSPRRL